MSVIFDPGFKSGDTAFVNYIDNDRSAKAYCNIISKVMSDGDPYYIISVKPRIANIIGNINGVENLSFVHADELEPITNYISVVVDNTK